MMSNNLVCLLILFIFILSGCGGGGGGQNSLASSLPANSAPNAKLVSSVSSGISPLEVEFDASESTDSDGSIESYSWDFGDGDTASGRSVIHTFDAGTAEDQSYTVALTITDNNGAQSTTRTTIAAMKNSLPNVTWWLSQPDPMLRIIEFDASDSNDPEGHDLVYRWSFGDGEGGEGGQLKHEYAENGKYTVQLTVDDQTGRTVTSENIVTVTNGLFRVSGQIRLATDIVVDSDTNNRASMHVPNNNFDEPQQLPVPAEVVGFVTYPGTGGGQYGDDRFANVSDEFDVFMADLAAGQKLQLHIADWNSGSNDLDLYVFDAGGNLRAFSAGVEAFEELDVAASGVYYVVVQAWWGQSGYNLSLFDTQESFVSAVKSPMTHESDFILGEVLGKPMPEIATNVHGSLKAAAALITDAGPARFLHMKASDAVGRVFAKSWDARPKDIPSLLISELGVHLVPEYARKLETISTLKRIRSTKKFEHVELNWLFSPSSVNDPLAEQLWHYEQVSVPAGWSRATGAGVIVAILDTGILWGHEDLAGQMVPGWDFVRDPDMALDGDGIDPDPRDPGDDPFGSGDSWHGSHVAGTVAAIANNSVGIVGAAFDSKIMPIRVLGFGGGSLADIIDGIYFAARLPNASGVLPARRADIINMSLGARVESQLMQDAVNAARNAGSIVVAAAGNDATNADFYSPAGLDGVISVAAVGRNGAPAPYTNRGGSIDVTAPGGNLTGLNVDSGILSAVGVEAENSLVGSGYAALQGTSMAAPHVSAIIALMKEVAPTMTPAQFDQLLADFLVTSGSGSRDPEFGFGLINAERALDAAAGLASGEPVSRLYFEYGNQLNLWRAASGEVVLNATGPDLSVTGWGASVGWLTANYVDTGDNGVGRYRIAVDGAELDPGGHLGQLTFLASNGTRVELYVSFTQMGTEHSQGTYGGAVYVLLLDYATNEVMSVVEAVYDDELGGYLYQSDVATGQSYWLLAGSDPDNDYLLCEVDELCAFHESSETQGVPLEIAPGDYGGNVRGIDFVLDVERPQSAAALLLQSGHNLFSRAREPITPPMRRP